MEGKFRNDRHFEERIVQALIVDHSWAEQMIEVLNVNYFNVDYLQEVSGIIFDYYKKFQAFPSFGLVCSIAKNDIESELTRDQVVSYLKRIKDDPLNGDLAYIKEESLDFCRKRKLFLALEDSLSLIKDRKYEDVLVNVKNAIMAGTDNDIGHDYFDGFEGRMAEVCRNPVATPWKEINDITGGGPSGGDLCVLCAGTGFGKSHGLVEIGQQAAKQGLNVAHYTFELGDKAVALRYDSRISMIPFDDLREYKQDVFESMQKISGNIVVRSFPAKKATALTLKNHVQKLILKDKKPDILIVDYGDLLRSSKSYDQKRLEEEAAYEDLKGLAEELNVPIWTATQTNREGLDVDVITLKQIAECFGKAMVSDFFLTMSRHKDKDAMGNHVGTLFVAKSRLGPDGIKYPYMIDTSRSKIEILKEEEAYDGYGEVNDPQAILKARFKEFQREFNNR